MKRILKFLVSIALFLAMSSMVFATEHDTNTKDTVIATQVPETHTIKIQTDGNGMTFYNGLAVDSLHVDRMSEPTILIRGESGYITDKVTLDGLDITEKIKGGYYTFDKVHKDSVLKVSFKMTESGMFKFHLVGTIHKDGVPLMHTQVELRSKLKTDRTDTNGRFVFSDVVEGHHSLSVVDDAGRIIAYTEFRLIRDKVASGVEIEQQADGLFDVRVSTAYAMLNLEFNQREDGRLEIIKGTATTASEDNSQFPPTGDHTNVFSYVLLVTIAIGVIVIIVKKK